MAKSLCTVLITYLSSVASEEINLYYRLDLNINTNFKLLTSNLSKLYDNNFLKKGIHKGKPNIIYLTYSNIHDRADDCFQSKGTMFQTNNLNKKFSHL